MQMNTRVFTYLEDPRIPIPGLQHKTWLSQRRQTEREHLLRWSGYIRHMDTTSAKWLMTEVSYVLPCINTLQINSLTWKYLNPWIHCHKEYFTPRQSKKTKQRWGTGKCWIYLLVGLNLIFNINVSMFLQFALLYRLTVIINEHGLSFLPH